MPIAPVVVKPSDPQSTRGNTSGPKKKAKINSPASNEAAQPTEQAVPEAKEASGEAEEIEEEGTGVLAGLLGGYDSDSDTEEGAGKEEKMEKDAKGKLKEPPQLPSAADLLG